MISLKSPSKTLSKSSEVNTKFEPLDISYISPSTISLPCPSKQKQDKISRLHII